MKTNSAVPNEILHWSERAEFKAWQRERKMAFIENVIFALLIVTLIALSFYAGRLIERHIADFDKLREKHAKSSIWDEYCALVEMLRANQHYSGKVDLSDLYEVYLKPVESAILTGDIKAKQ